MQVTAVIPTHNPHPDRLRRTLLALRAQTLPAAAREVILVNNASRQFPADDFFAACAPENFSIVSEPRLGLTAARLAGFAAARGELIVLVDDDNVLAPDFLATALRIARDFPFLGSWSGNVRLVFEPGATPPPAIWRGYLTERAATTSLWSNDPGHHDSTPWGAGLCVRRTLAQAYRHHCAHEPARLKLDLSGQQLTYGGDTDIAYHGCTMGLGKGVFPELQVDHLIPPERCVPAYLLRAIEGHAYSEIMHHFILHGTAPAQPGGWKFHLARLARLLLADSRTRLTERTRAAGRARAFRELSRAS
jgi:hypothetical protein